MLTEEGTFFKPWTRWVATKLPGFVKVLDFAITPQCHVRPEFPPSYTAKALLDRVYTLGYKPQRSLVKIWK